MRSDLPLHHEQTVSVPARPEAVFAFADDHAKLAGHMSRRSWMTGGGRMETRVDEGHGQALGSHIRMSGRVMGVPLALDEVVTEREAPRHKAWETVGTPRLLVVGPYRMSLDVEPSGEGSRVRVAIDYALPPKNVWLGRLFGGSYARWCVRQMTGDVAARFGGAA